MKTILKVLGIIGFLAFLGFSIVSCGDIPVDFFANFSSG